MSQRGRKSSAELAVVAETDFRAPKPPKTYTEEHAQHWRAIVASKPADWWDSGTLPLLDVYVREIVEYRRVTDMIESGHPIHSEDKVALYDKLDKVKDRISKRMAKAAGQLRLTNQSRY